MAGDVFSWNGSAKKLVASLFVSPLWLWIHWIGIEVERSMTDVALWGKQI